MEDQKLKKTIKQPIYIVPSSACSRSLITGPIRTVDLMGGGIFYLGEAWSMQLESGLCRTQDYTVLQRNETSLLCVF